MKRLRNSLILASIVIIITALLTLTLELSEAKKETSKEDQETIKETIQAKTTSTAKISLNILPPKVEDKLLKKNK